MNEQSRIISYLQKASNMKKGANKQETKKEIRVAKDFVRKKRKVKNQQ